MEYSPSSVPSIHNLSIGDLQFIVIDGAEGTLRQFALQPEGGRVLQVSRVNKIFVTHMHGKSFYLVPRSLPHPITLQRTMSWASPHFCATSSASLTQTRSLRAALP